MPRSSGEITSGGPLGYPGDDSDDLPVRIELLIGRVLELRECKDLRDRDALLHELEVLIATTPNARAHLAQELHTQLKHENEATAWLLRYFSASEIETEEIRSFMREFQGKLGRCVECRKWFQELNFTECGRVIEPIGTN